jgi:pSer/pThr/pTyr-binding forkhead associated (FHA) protein
MRIQLRVDQSGVPAKTLDLSSDPIRLGRGAECEVAVDPIVYPKVSALHARIESTAQGFVLVHLSRNNKTLLNNAPIDGASPVKAGDRIRLGFTGPAIEILDIQPTSQDGRISADFGSTVQADARHLALLRGTGRTERFALGTGGVIGRDAAAVQYHLDHPHVSRLHTSLAVDGERVVLADLGSSNGTYVNGQRLARPTLLKPGDNIDIGPFSLRFDGSGLVSRSGCSIISAWSSARGSSCACSGRAGRGSRPCSPS